MAKKKFLSNSSVFAMVVACLLAIGIVLLVRPLNKHDSIYKLEPAISTLEGKIITRMYYGPPNYGENPDTDEKEYPYILQLNEPIKVMGTSMTEKPVELLVYEVQLVAHGDKSIQYIQANKNKEVEVSGQLFEAFTGHHHTSLLLDIDSTD